MPKKLFYTQKHDEPKKKSEKLYNTCNIFMVNPEGKQEKNNILNIHFGVHCEERVNYVFT